MSDYKFCFPEPQFWKTFTLITYVPWEYIMKCTMDTVCVIN